MAVMYLQCCKGAGATTDASWVSCSHSGKEKWEEETGGYELMEKEKAGGSGGRKVT